MFNLFVLSLGRSAVCLMSVCAVSRQYSSSGGHNG